MLRRHTIPLLAAPLLMIRPAQAQNRAGEGIASNQAAPANAQQAEMLGAMAFAMSTAQLAERIAENPAVKNFASLEAEEQTAFSTARQLAGLRVPTVELMPEQRRQEMIALREMRGPDFDRMFIEGQAQGHRELLRLHEAAVRNPTSRDEGILATVAIPAIRTHIAMLEGIQRMMGR